MLMYVLLIPRSLQAITQHIMCLENHEKERTLVSLLNKLNKASDGNPVGIPKTIIFVSRKNDCDILANVLYR
jgi:superfamily II DNA/RNA helicase